RLLGELRLGDRSLNRELLRAGMAWHDRRHAPDAELAGLEREARQARRGLWGDSRAVAPWEWCRP
ncbi:MAG: micrococcal nuclease, partial [Candidatus Melainabacteria bacterium HGW-Melainabacteria-1]